MFISHQSVIIQLKINQPHSLDIFNNKSDNDLVSLISGWYDICCAQSEMTVRWILWSDMNTHLQIKIRGENINYFGNNNSAQYSVPLWSINNESRISGNWFWDPYAWQGKQTNQVVLSSFHWPKKSHKRFNFYQLEFPVYSLPYFHPISQNKVNFFSTYFVYFLWKYSKSIESRCLQWAIANCTDDLVLFSKWKDFRLIRWIKRIGQNQPYIN